MTIPWEAIKQLLGPEYYFSGAYQYIEHNGYTYVFENYIEMVVVNLFDKGPYKRWKLRYVYRGHKLIKDYKENSKARHKV